MAIFKQAPLQGNKGEPQEIRRESPAFEKVDEVGEVRGLQRILRRGPQLPARRLCARGGIRVQNEPEGGGLDLL